MLPSPIKPRRGFTGNAVAVENRLLLVVVEVLALDPTENPSHSLLFVAAFFRAFDIFAPARGGLLDAE